MAMLVLLAGTLVGGLLAEHSLAAAYLGSHVRLTPSGGSSDSAFGRAVSVSADGNTVLVGAPRDSNLAGAAWLFARTGSTWSQLGPKLTADGASGEGGAEEGGEEGEEDRFGGSVVLSADGNTALVGSARDEGGRGAVWAFARTGATWSQQGPKLTGAEESGVGRFGRSVALSADGNTAVIGGSADSSGIGAVWVFTRVGSTWLQEGPKLTDNEASRGGRFGVSVAVSEDGSTALVGGPGDSGYTGAAWLFQRSGSVWTQQGSKLAGGQEAGAGHFGRSVALSSDGETALIGGRRDANGLGAAWVFTRTGTSWAQQGPKLIGDGEEGEGEFGDSVALSADGNTALVGGPMNDGRRGGAWMFARSGGSWTQAGGLLEDIHETGKGWFGYSVALSADGQTAVIGSPNESGKEGTAAVLTDTLAEEAPGAGESAPEAGESAPEAGESQTSGVEGGLGRCEGLPVLPGLRCRHRTTSRSGCRASLATHRIAVHGGRRAAVRLTLTGTGKCSGRIVLTVRRRDRRRRLKTTPLGTAVYTVSSGGASTIGLALNASGRSLLRARRGRVNATLVIVQSASSPPTTSTRAILAAVPLPRPAARKR
jgi:hypothetical protein